MNKEDLQESRVKAVLGDDEEPVSEETVKRFCEHLKKHLKFPFEVTGIEDFDWEEFYVVGPGEKQEYERLKKTQPSHKDRYDLLEIDLEADSEWMLFSDEDIPALVRRKSDGRQFYLGLAELEATDRKSNHYQLLDDYAVWFVNNR